MASRDNNKEFLQRKPHPKQTAVPDKRRRRKRKRTNEETEKEKMGAPANDEEEHHSHDGKAKALGTDREGNENAKQQRDVESERRNQQEQDESSVVEEQQQEMTQSRKLSRSLLSTSKRSSSNDNNNNNDDNVDDDDEDDMDHGAGRWTELTAVGHVLADETHKYLVVSSSSSSSLSDGERRHLAAWVDAVQTKIRYQSGLVSQNVGLAAELRDHQSRVRNLRDDLMIARTQTRKTERETEIVAAQRGQSREATNALQGASKLLAALEQLTKACRETQKE